MLGLAIKALGSPIHTVSIVAAAYDPSEAERPCIYAVSCGKVATLHIIDVYERRSVRSFELEGSTHCWGVVRLPDGTLYMSSAQGMLYRLRAGADALENLGKPIESETFLWNLTYDEQGHVYGGTWNGGKVFGYDPANGTFRDYGTVVEGEQYGRCVSAAGGYVYAGIGTVRAHLVAIDTFTGDKTEIPLPEGCEAEQTVYDVTCAGGYLFARLSTTNTMLVYDLAAREWIDRVGGCIGWNVSDPHPESGRFYFVKDNRIHGYDADTRELFPTSWTYAAPARNFAWIRWVDQTLYPGWSLLSVMSDGNFFVFNPQADRGAIIETNLPGQPNKIQSLAVSPDDRLYAGGFFSGGNAMYDPEADAVTEYGSVGQPEGMLVHEGSLYMGIYSYAIMYRFDPRQPWKKGVNPARLFSLKEHGQDRPFALVSAGRRVAIGTVPTYGQLGGALTLYDPESGEIDVHRHVVEHQSIVSLAYREDIVIGGTSVHGGLGTVPEAAEGKLFLWDPKTRSKLWEGVPVPGEKAVYALEFDSEGRLWGATALHLFQFDLAAREIARVISLEPYIPEEAKNGWSGWHAGSIWPRPDGSLGVLMLGVLFRFDPGTGELKVLQEGVGRAIGDGAGRTYFTRDTELFLMDAMDTTDAS